MVLVCSRCNGAHMRSECPQLFPPLPISTEMSQTSRSRLRDLAGKFRNCHFNAENLANQLGMLASEFSRLAAMANATLTTGQADMMDTPSLKHNPVSTAPGNLDLPPAPSSNLSIPPGVMVARGAEVSRPPFSLAVQDLWRKYAHQMEQKIYEGMMLTKILYAKKGPTHSSRTRTKSSLANSYSAMRKRKVKKKQS